MAAQEPLFSFPPSSLVEDHGWWAFWHEGPLSGVRIVGDLTDERNPVWRARLDEHFAESGWPGFALLDVRHATPAASMANRVKAAMWARKVLTHIPEAVIATREEHEVFFAIRIILRVASMNNARLIADDAQAEALLVQARARREEEAA